MSAGAGFGAYVTFTVSLLSFAISVLGLKSGNKDIVAIDILFLVLAICAIPLWLVVKQPILSMILLSTIDMLGFVPTIRKSWKDPYSETFVMYVITAVRHSFSIVGLVEYNIVTILFPLTWVIANAGFAAMLYFRRKVVIHLKNQG